MAHKTLIGGTAYEISGGRTLVNGTGYSIDKGKTMVGGTVYEVGFAPAEVTLTINNVTSSNKYAYLIIDGVTYGGNGYSSGVQAITIPSGTVIECYVKDDYKYNRYIKVNGVSVSLSDTASYTSVYNYTAVGNATINLKRGRWEDSDYERYYYGYIEITEE